MGEEKKKGFGLLSEKMKECSKLLAEARDSKASVLIRYHNDADGICSGLCISGIFSSNISSFPSDSATYLAEDSYSDARLLSGKKGAGLALGEGNALAIILDFGVNEESVSSLRELKASGAKLIIIDHHPFCKEAEELADLLVSPISFSLESKYTAGYLCSEIAKIAMGSGIAKGKGGAGKEGEVSEKLERYKKIALAGDRSMLGKIEENERKAALVLEYVATYKEFPKNLEFYRKVLEDKELFASIYASAREKFEEIIREAGNCTRVVRKGKLILHYINIDKLMKKHHFPSKAKALTQVFDAVCENEKGHAVVVIGWGESLITFRVSPEAILLGFSAAEIIEKVKLEVKGGINTGGGHAAAASIRAKKGYGPLILKEIEKLI